MLVGSEQQENIWQEICGKENDPHVIVEALAGCGKTTTALEATRRLKIAESNLKVGFSAFNNKIAKEIESRVGGAAFVKTAHALGLMSYKSRFGHVRVDKDKCYRLLTAPGSGFKDYEWDFVKPVLRLVDLCKFNLAVDPSDEFLREQVERHIIDIENNEVRIFELTRMVLGRSINMKQVVDFSDMLFMPILEDVHGPQFDILFVDESQDLNPAMQELVLRHCKEGRMVVIGDEHQAIYGFMGADLHSMETMKGRLSESSRGLKVLPLTRTRRCPKKVVESVQYIVPQFEAMPEAPEGSFEYVTVAAPGPGDMVICRTNAPLVGMAFACLRKNIPAMIAGRDIAEGLRTLVRKLRPMDINDLTEKLHEYEERETIRLERGRKYTSVDALKDRCATLEVLMEGETSLDGLDRRLNTLFVDGVGAKNAVLCTTAHRSKGLEAPRVWIINPELLPWPKAQGEAIQQELNLKYVAHTRAMNDLRIVQTQK